MYSMIGVDTVAPAVPVRLQIVGSLVLAVLLGLVGQWLLLSESDLISGLIVWAAAVVVFAYGLALAPSLHAAAEPRVAGVDAGTIPLRLELALFVCVFAVGTFFRLYRLDSIPAGLNHDAAWNGLYSITITQGRHYSPYVAEAWGRETMFHHVIAFWQLVIGPQKLAINLAAATVGLATLPVFYLFIRRLFNQHTALVSTLLLSVSGWHLTLSKAGWRVIFVPFFTCLVFYFLVRAIQERKLRDFVLAGIFLGLSLDTYDAARIIPFTVVAYVLYELIRDRSLFRGAFWQLALCVVIAFIAFAPLGWYAANHWLDFTDRSRFLWIGNQVKEAGSLAPLFTNIKDALLMFNLKGNGDDFFVKEPLLDTPLAVFFILGLVIAVVRWRQRPYFLLLTILFFMLVVGVISKPNGNRNIGAVVPAVALGGVFLTEAWLWLRAHFPDYRSAISFALVAVLFLTGYLAYDRYLGPERHVQWGFYPETTRVGLYMKKIAPDYEIHAAAGNWPRDSLTYLSYQGEGDPFKWVYTYTELAPELLTFDPSADKGTAFIVEATPFNASVIEALKKRFPSARSDSIWLNDRQEGLVATVLLVPAGAVAEGPAQFTPPVQPGLSILPAQPSEPVRPAPPSAADRDATRKSDLDKIAAALEVYREREGSYPSTSGNLQTACAFAGLDQLCKLSAGVGEEALHDARKDDTRFGYWYSSDGNTFNLYASLEGKPESSCRVSDRSLAAKPNLYCLNGGEQGAPR